MSVRIRFADPERDASRILAVYAPYIGRTAITFETEVPDGTAFAARVAGIAREFPYLLLEIDGELAGYAYAHRQAERAAYQWNAELSVYLDRSRTGQGLGRRLYTALMEMLRLQGIHTVYALVTVPNEKSEGLHGSMGFRHMGTQRSTGYKDGAWRDVAWFEKQIAPYDPDPAPLAPIGQVPLERLAEILAAC